MQKLLLQALAERAARPPVHDRVPPPAHDLPSASNVQRAARALIDREIVVADRGSHEIAEPFLAEWIRVNITGSELDSRR